MTESRVIVRRAAEHDLIFVGQDGYLPAEVVRRKIKNGEIFIAEHGDEQVGYLRLEHLWSKIPYIELIRVLEAHRRTGIGRALLTYVETEIATRGHRALYSSSQVDESDPQAWHRRMGFEECGFLAGVNEGGIGEVFFRKVLAADGEAE